MSENPRLPPSFSNSEQEILLARLEVANRQLRPFTLPDDTLGIRLEQLEQASRLVFKSEFFRQLTSEDREPRLLPFILYLGDEYVSDAEAKDIFETLRLTIQHAFHCITEQEYAPVYGSWFKQAWLKTKKSLSKQDFDFLNQNARRALQLKAVESQEAEQTLKYAEALKNIDALFANEGEVSCLIGNLLYIKTEHGGGSKISAVTLSDKNLTFLLNNPGLLKSGYKNIIDELSVRGESIGQEAELKLGAAADT